MNLPSNAQLRDALRLAIQSGVAAAVMFLVMEWLDLPEVFVGVLSAVLIVQPSVGSTLGSGMQRVAATLVGCVVGVATLWALPYGYGTAVALAISMLLMNFIAGLRPEWRYGAVAAVALALGSDQDVTATAIDRCLSIGIGAAVGIVVSLVVWPERASTRAERKLRKALTLLSEAMERAASMDSDDDAHVGWQSDYRSVLGDINTLVANVRIADNSHLAKRRDAIEEFARSLVIFAHCVRADQVVRAKNDAVERAKEMIRTLSTDLAKGVLDAEDEGRPLHEPIRDVSERFDEGVQRWLVDCECQQPRGEDAMAFAFRELHAALERMVEAFAEGDDGQGEKGGNETRDRDE